MFRPVDPSLGDAMKALCALAFLLLLVCLNPSVSYFGKAMGGPEAAHTVELVSLEIGRGCNETWAPYYYFFHEEVLVVKITARNNANEAKMTTIFLSVFDDIKQSFYSSSGNITLSAEETRSIYYSVYVPNWVLPGDQCILTSIVQTWPEGAFSPEKTRMFFILPTFPIRDTSVLSVTPSADEVYVGWRVSVIVAVENQGNITEDFTVTLKYELEGLEHILDTTTVRDLPPNMNTTLTYNWTTQEASLHTIMAETSVLPDETDTADNLMESLTKVKVKITGDVNGDYIVDVKDVSLAGLAFGSYLGGSRWNIQADTNQDGEIDISDISNMARNYGHHHP
jgi:hypothetical protein